MISLHTIYVVTLVSQATSALALALLAYNDHRLHGLRALAGACGLHAAAIFLMPMWRNANSWVPEAISAAFLPLIFFLIHEGLQSLVQERKRPPRAVVLLVGAVMLLVVVLAPWSQLWSMQIARCAGAILMARTVWMLWQTKRGSTRIPALVTAALLGCILCTMLARVPLEPRVPALPFLLFLRKLTIVEITLLAFSFLAVQQAESKRLLHDETRQDALTGLPNRRAMEEQAAAEMRLSERTGRPLALLMMDLDEFKRLNDTWGHPFGDYALRAVGDVLLRAAKAAGNPVARLSGEEFAMLLPDHALAAASRIAELLRAAIADLVLVQNDQRVLLTVSIGVALRHAGDSTWTEMLRRADAALYRAKLAGRNRVMICEEASDSANLSLPDAHNQIPFLRTWRSKPFGDQPTEQSHRTDETEPH
ncbi:MAG TPA: GGDEF domain-containing protein [Terracidiphilus sp.]|jgi:diguanylate cyclase (GGDEF)-like protein